MERSDPLAQRLAAQRLAAQRFRGARAAFATRLAGLLGAGAPSPIGDAAQAAALGAEFRASHEAAEPDEWALVRREWPIGETTEPVAAVHRLARNLGGRRVWLLCLGDAVQAAALGSDLVLDNPLGFAAATGHDLALLDAEVPAGLRLARHELHGPTDVRSGWALDVWGEPWLSAATRAFRGIG